MDFSKWIESNIKIIELKLLQSIRMKEEEMNSLGLLRSGMASSECLSVAFETINNEIARITTEIGKLKLIKKEEVEKVRIEISKFITEKSEYILNYISSRHGTVIGKEILNTKVEEAKSILTIFTEVIDQERRSRIYRICWDTAKIVVTAIVGGIIGAYINFHFGKLPK